MKLSRVSRRVAVVVDLTLLCLGTASGIALQPRHTRVISFANHFHPRLGDCFRHQFICVSTAVCIAHWHRFPIDGFNHRFKDFKWHRDQLSSLRSILRITIEERLSFEGTFVSPVLISLCSCCQEHCVFTPLFQSQPCPSLAAPPRP